MCIVSGVHDTFYERWRQPAQVAPYPTNEWLYNIPTQAEINEFRRLLEKARQQDEAEGNADCGTEEKKARVKELLLSLAAEFDLDIDITFLN